MTPVYRNEAGGTGNRTGWVSPSKIFHHTDLALPSLAALVAEAEGRLTEEQRKLYGWAVEGLLIKTAEGLTTFRLITVPPETRAAALLEIL